MGNEQRRHKRVFISAAAMVPAADRGIPDSAEQQHSECVTESDTQAMSRKPLAEQETGVTRADNLDRSGVPDITRVDTESDSGCGAGTDIPGIIITENSGDSGQASESADGTDDEDGAFIPHDSGDVGQPAVIRAGVSRQASDKEPSWINPDLYERVFSNGRVILAVAAALWAVIEFLILPHI